MSTIVSAALTKVEIFNVTVNHYHVQTIPAVETLIAGLREKQEAFELRAAAMVSPDRLQDSAIDVIALFGKLLDMIKPQAFGSKYVYSTELLNAMKSGVALLDMYERVSAQVPGFGHVIRDHLAKRLDAFYRDSEAGQAINTEWLGDAMFYDWLIANEMLEDPQLNRWADYKYVPTFSAEELQAFEQEKGAKIAKAVKEITAENGGRCYMANPHRDPMMRNYFEAYKLQRAGIKDMGSIPEQHRLA
ncbi:hypothetical protein [Burkholderia sp. Ac-20365]|uniref:hypothetical protein n=1 Tax=Burkholderia sp. Ac-20365 TaxID=2703897 RepID=UPI00197C48AB|nr:hypothetical protein [Burkholderia sp. Ac-20365]MBN3760997.1 hypothetical protein [Burkholderia sp. Ac-20365]